MNIIVTMNGLGKRFKDGGYTTPKALLDVNGEPLFAQAVYSILESFEVKNDDNDFHFFFLVREALYDDVLKWAKNNLKNYTVNKIEKDTNGPVETILYGTDDVHRQTIIVDCDIWFNSKDYAEKIKNYADCVVPTFESNSKNYCYAKMQDDKVLELVEKNPISNNAVLGAYYFSNFDRAKKLAKAMVEENKNECFMSELCNKYGEVTLAKIDEWKNYGTPEEYERAIKK